MQQLYRENYKNILKGVKEFWVNGKSIMNVRTQYYKGERSQIYLLIQSSPNQIPTVFLIEEYICKNCQSDFLKCY